MNQLIKLLLLFVMSFSIAHGVVVDVHPSEHCSVQEFVAEFSHPIQHDIDEHKGDLCNSHFMLHLSFILPPNFLLSEISKSNVRLLFTTPIKKYLYINNSFRPPIV